MSTETQNTAIRLRGVRQNNLKGFDLDLPINKFIVITGPSGSGKSSLAFETLYAEGQRRYIETFSPYTRQFFDRMDKPRVDSIECIPPAIAIEQRNSIKTSRSTVGTMTEICDYMKVLMPVISQLYCMKCNKPVQRESPQAVWDKINALLKNPSFNDDPEILITFSLPLSEKLSLKDSLKLVTTQGYQRLLVKNKVVRIEEIESQLLDTGKKPEKKKSVKNNEIPSELQVIGNEPVLTVVQDRIRLNESNRARFIDACEQAYHFGKGIVSVYWKSPDDKSDEWTNPPYRFSNKLHCATCDISYNEPQPALFSYNNPIGACPTCHGFGRTITIDWREVIPDPSLSIEEGVISPWRRGYSRECYYELLEICKRRNIPTRVPFNHLPLEIQEYIIYGDPDYGKDKANTFPNAWYGVKGFFDYLEGKSYKMHVRVFLSRYRKYTLCPDCKGGRLRPESLLYRLPVDEELVERFILEGKCDSNTINLGQFYLLPIEDAFRVIESIWKNFKGNRNSPVYHALGEVYTRLKYLVEIGLGYLTLNRSSRTLSGGEAERVNLTACLGTKLVNTLYILDEPSIGLHPRDTDRLISILKNLRDIGNTVVVVEHDPDVIRSADYIVDLGPASGERGGYVVFKGSFQELLNSPDSLTGKYLSGRMAIEIPKRRPVARVTNGVIHWQCQVLKMFGAKRHNLKNINVDIPLKRFVCITGVSGSGKSTLIRECLVPTLSYWLRHKYDEYIVMNKKGELVEEGDTAEDTDPEEDNEIDVLNEVVIDGYDTISYLEVVDQSAPGKTPRSNPATYLKVFDNIRNLFAKVAEKEGKLVGEMRRIFSFNTEEGRCPHCSGMGYEKVEMQFLSDVYIKCPVCQGKRYNSDALAIYISPDSPQIRDSQELTRKHAKNIADVLDLTADECIEWLKLFKPAKDIKKAIGILEVMQKVGLGYLKLGQPLTTLSGGECQRLKLAKAISGMCLEKVDLEIIDESTNDIDLESDLDYVYQHRGDYVPPNILFVFDEPTTGLHMNDVRVLINVFQQLVDAGNSVLVIEHNLDVIKCADWIIDLGPEAGDKGGKIVVCGTPEQVAACPKSYTGMALRSVLNNIS